jgi:hypothetical protein
MRKVYPLVAVVGLLGVALVGAATAADFIAEVCWHPAPFDDVIKLSVSQGGEQYELHGSMATEGYTLPFTGNAFIVDDEVVVGGVFVGNGLDFEGCAALATYGTLDISTLNGSQTLRGVGCSFSPDITTWTRIPCPLGPVGAPGREAHEKAQGKQH